MRPMLLALLLCPSAAVAQTAPPQPLDRVGLWVGGFKAGSDTTLSARAGIDDVSADGRFSLEGDLGMDQEPTVAHLRLDLLAWESQGFSFEYFDWRRAAERRIERRITYDGRTYEASARVRGEVDYAFGSAAWRWWFGDAPTVWGVGLGLAWYGIDTVVEGEATFEGDTVQASSRSSDEAVAPLLALGWRHAFSDRWRVYADLSGVAKDGGPLQGHIIDVAVGAEWFPTRRLGLALEYGQTRIRLDRERDQASARLDLRLHGPSLFLRLR